MEYYLQGALGKGEMDSFLVDFETHIPCLCLPLPVPEGAGKGMGRITGCQVSKEV